MLAAIGQPRLMAMYEQIFGLYDLLIAQVLLTRAEEAKIQYQLEVLTAGTTDAMAIQMVREGIPTGCLSIPCRYIHSPSEMVDYGDVQDSVKLLLTILGKPVEV